MELFFCIVFDLHYLCRRKSGTRQSESKLSLRSFALSLQKNKEISKNYTYYIITLKKDKNL